MYQSGGGIRRNWSSQGDRRRGRRAGTEIGEGVVLGMEMGEVMDKGNSIGMGKGGEEGRE